MCWALEEIGKWSLTELDRDGGVGVWCSMTYRVIFFLLYVQLKQSNSQDSRSFDGLCLYELQKWLLEGQFTLQWPIPLFELKKQFFLENILMYTSQYLSLSESQQLQGWMFSHLLLFYRLNLWEENVVQRKGEGTGSWATAFIS